MRLFGTRSCPIKTTCSYKTKETFGEQQIDIPQELRVVIDEYIGKSTKVRPFLTLNGKAFPHDNTMTYVINKALGRQIGSSQLRHIFLRNKFSDDTEDRMTTAKAMAHNIGTQIQYIAK